MWRGRQGDKKGREGGAGGEVILFESENVGSLSAFLSGCCSEAAGWRTLPAAPNRNRAHDALIKKPDESTRRHAHTHTHHPHPRP